MEEKNEETVKNGMLLLTIDDGKVTGCAVQVAGETVAIIPLENLLAMIERFEELKKSEMV